MAFVKTDVQLSHWLASLCCRRPLVFKHLADKYLMRTMLRFFAFLLSLFTWIIALAVLIRTIKDPQISTAILATFLIVTATLTSSNLVEKLAHIFPTRINLLRRMRIFAIFLVVISCAGIGGYVHLLLTNTKYALLIKAKLQKYVGLRNVSDEVLWTTVDEVARVEKITNALKSKDPSLCEQSETIASCFQKHLADDLKNAKMGPVGHMLYMATVVSITMKDSESTKEGNSEAIKKTRILNMVGAIVEIASNIEKCPSNVEQRITNTFGPIPDNQKEVLAIAIQEPVQKFREGFEKTIKKVMLEVDKIKSEDPEIMVLEENVKTKLSSLNASWKKLDAPSSKDREPANK